MSRKQDAASEMKPIPLEDLRHLFDLAVDTPLVCSGSFDDDDVDVLRRVAVMLGVDPDDDAITPPEFAAKYPHAHRRRPVHAEPKWINVPVDPKEDPKAGPGRMLSERGYPTQTRLEAGEEAQARIAAERADETCQAGTYMRRCGKLPADPIHTQAAG